MKLFKLLTMLEQRGVVDYNVTGHKTERPSEVKRGEAADRLTISHESFSVYKPNSVSVKNVKAGSLAGLVGTKPLSGSSHVQLVWRNWVSFGKAFFEDTFVGGSCQDLPVDPCHGYWSCFEACATTYVRKSLALLSLFGLRQTAGRLNPTLCTRSSRNQASDFQERWILPSPPEIFLL